MSEQIVSVMNISKSFLQNNGESMEILHDISFDIMRNEIVALVGHSGCGKSTLLRIVCMLETADKGSVLLDNVKCVKPCKDIIMLYQDFNQLMPWKTVLGNVMHPLLATNTIKSKETAKKHAMKRISDVELTGFEESYPHQLSGGMKQRAAVARALALQPRILLMDEPFASLDNITRKTLQVLTRSVCDKYKISALLVTHSVDEAIIMADRIIIMDRNPGKIKTIIKNNVRNESPKYQGEFAAVLLELLRT